MGLIADVGWHVTRRVVSVAPARDVPEGRVVHLPGRGRTYVVDTGPAPSSGARPQPTLMLLHALACTGVLTWYPALAALRERYRVVLFDQRWHGQGIRSARFTLEDCADDAVAVADALGLETFVPVGYSMGSLVTQLAWRQHPDRVAGAVMCASTSRFTLADRDARAVKVAAGRIARVAAARRRAALAGAPGPKHEYADDNRWAVGHFRTTSASEIAGAAAVISRFDSSGWIAGMDVPAAVVVTAQDRLIPPQHQHRLARLIPHATTYEVDAGHASCVMRADRFTPALLAACASVAGRAAASPR